MAGANPRVRPVLSPVERLSVTVTAALAFAAIAVAGLAYAARVPLAMAVAVGCIGGLVHEMFQSGGTVLFFARRQDGLYLGSLAGILLGGVSGLLSAHGAAAVDGVQLQNVAYDAFLAGVGLKGLAEAATGRSVAVRAQAPPSDVSREAPGSRYVPHESDPAPRPLRYDRNCP